ncbi:hypothetical protein ED733_006835 [Metarhizium rileyi]|uniref:Uncharacterized protein n=1 Tax=Metarhizium rileyi (strain RCEF 4871) TaxID=1649241 RepID=A0A5C6GF69_METRR|nr:hypothetical protein ED733_006835 [Metarhizium rileyi]
MPDCMNIVCLAGAAATGALNDEQASSSWLLRSIGSSEVEQSEYPVVILCHHPSLPTSKVICEPIVGDGKEQLLTKAAINIVQRIGGLKFDDELKPSWLPTDSTLLVPPGIPALEGLFRDLRKLPVEVIAFISPEEDCSDFIRALRLTASPELLCPVKLRDGIRKIGKINPPESWEEDSKVLYSTYYETIVKLAAVSFDSTGHMIGVSPTANSGKVNVVKEILGLSNDDLRAKDVPSGESNQPRSLEQGARGALKRTLGALIACLTDEETGLACRPVLFAIESFMDDVGRILDSLHIQPEFPVLGDFASNVLLDTADTQPVFVITKGTPFPKAVDDLRGLLGTGHTNGELLAAIFPDVEPRIDPKNWHKWFFPKEGRYDDIRQGCLSDLRIANARFTRVESSTG